MRTSAKKVPKAAAQTGLTESFFDKEEDRIANKALFVKPAAPSVQDEPMEGKRKFSIFFLTPKNFSCARGGGERKNK